MAEADPEGTHEREREAWEKVQVSVTASCFPTEVGSKRDPALDPGLLGNARWFRSRAQRCDG
jgi:hypothetical protein